MSLTVCVADSSLTDISPWDAPIGAYRFTQDVGYVYKRSKRFPFFSKELDHVWVVHQKRSDMRWKRVYGPKATYAKCYAFVTERVKGIV